MSLHRWLQLLRSALALPRDQRHHGRRAPHRDRAQRGSLEVLEDRSVPAFLAPVDYTVGWYPQELRAEDFNGDAIPDLATLNPGTSDVSVLLGNADGTFQPARNTFAAWYPLSLAVGDFNQDNKLDLATANYYIPGQDGVTVLLGTGEGTFTHAPSIGGLEWSDSIATGDLNSDGKLDLVTTSVNYSISYGYFSYVSVMIGNGDGTFAFNYVELEGYVTSLALADFDADGDDDVMVGGFVGGDDAEVFLKVFLSNGDGTLQAPSEIDGGADLASVTADFNADGNFDLVGVGGAGVAVSLGNGDGTYQPAQFFYAGQSGDGDSLVVADFNADGRPDAAVAHSITNKVSVLLNDGHWSEGDPPSVSISDAMVTEGNTGPVSATFAVTLSNAVGVDVTVHYATADISAAAGSDYMAASGTVTIPAGQTSATFTIAVTGDRLAEPTETFAVNLTAAVNATIGDGRGIGTILDNEPRISISDLAKSEGKKGKTTLFTFTVTLSIPYDQPVTVSFQTVNGTATTADNDYVARTGTLTFAPGETTKTITTEVKGDSKREASETFYLDLFGLSSNASFTKNRGLGTILNDD
jgi:hypothetical protein